MANNIRTIAWFAVAVLSATAARAATIYKWLDEQGTVHYSNERPPNSVRAQIIDTTEPVRAEPSAQPAQTQPQHNAPQAPPADMQSPEPTSQRPSLKEQEAAFAERRAARLDNAAREAQQQDSEDRRTQRACERARASLARTVAAAPRLAQKKDANQADVWVYRGDSTNSPSMNNAERSEAIGVLEAFIAKNCAKPNKQ
jgi:type IV secretory pathway VirB10-like protein